MKITAIEPIVLRIPFEDGGSGTGMTPQRWAHLDMVLVRITADNGLVGWGEAFGYFCQRAVAAAVTDLVAPLLIGRDPDDPAALNAEMQRKLALFGRYGITIFALSGVDIALWDLKAKAEGVDLATLLAGRHVRESVQAYASLVRYGEADLVARFAQRAAAEGYRSIKLHEVTMPEIRAGRAAIDRSFSFTVDVNCAWSERHAAEVLPELAELGTLWLEEPVFPPEDWEAMRRLGAVGHGVAIAAGENACTAMEFSRLVPAVTYPQPSVTKVGGISEFLRVAEIALRHGRTLMPHSPYFGPGYFATLQLAAALNCFGLFEQLYVWPQASTALRSVQPIRGEVPIPSGPGIGFEPNLDVLERYAAA
jgi:L-alanine-DL-glutamate epimerase-like enolase superfamily enzyme